MPEWPLEHRTREQAWGYVYAAERGDYSASPLELLQGLDDKAKRELAGLSAFGKSGNRPEFLSQSIEPFLLTTSPRRRIDPKHVRSALLRLGFYEQDE